MLILPKAVTKKEAEHYHKQMAQPDLVFVTRENAEMFKDLLPDEQKEQRIEKDRTPSDS